MHVVQSIEGNLLEYSHLLFRARTGRKGSASSLVTAAFCLDPKALGGDVRWHWASKILQVSLGLLSTAWGAPCVPEFGSVPPAEHLRWQWECAHEQLSLSLQSPTNYFSASQLCHFQSDTWGFQLFWWEFHLLYACKAKSPFGSCPCADLSRSGWVLRDHLAAFCGSMCSPAALPSWESIDFLVSFGESAFLMKRNVKIRTVM